MDNAFNTLRPRLLKPITSVVVITLIAGIFFSVPQTYALGTNENSPVTSNQNYQQTSKLGDFVKKVFNFFSEQSLVQNNLPNDAISSTEQTSCNKDTLLPFIDIQDSEYKAYITTLYDRGIVIGSSNKFTPNNDLRFYGMIKIIVDSYRSKIGYDIKTEVGLSQKNYFTNAGTGIDKISLKYLNTAYELGFLQGINDFDVSSKSYFQENASYSTIKQIFTNINNQFPLLVNSSVINQISGSENSITRGEYTEYVVNFFDFQPSQTTSDSCPNSQKINFSDIEDSNYKEDIQLLANLGIIDPQAYKFYPDNYLRNYEFIIMLTQTILKKENQELNIYVLDHTANISDLDPQSSYIKYFEYAYHNGFLNYGFDTQTGEPAVHPNKFLTIQEINNILSKITGKEVNFQSKSNDGLVTRGEFANILVDSFGLNSNENSNKNIVNNTYSKSSLLEEIGGRLKSSKLLSKL